MEKQGVSAIWEGHALDSKRNSLTAKALSCIAKGERGSGERDRAKDS